MTMTSVRLSSYKLLDNVCPGHVCCIPHQHAQDLHSSRHQLSLITQCLFCINACRVSLQELVTMGLVSEAELKAAIVTEFNPVRVAIHGGKECFTTDCLNIGVRPK